MKWKDLFDYLEKACNFHEDVEKIVRWTCHHDLRFVEEFCAMYNLNYRLVKEKLEFHDGYCDCECLFNATRFIDANSDLGKFAL